MNPSIAKTSKTIDYRKLHSPKGLYLFGYYIKWSDTKPVGEYQVRTAENGTLVHNSTAAYDCWQWVLERAAIDATQKEAEFLDEMEV